MNVFFIAVASVIMSVVAQFFLKSGMERIAGQGEPLDIYSLNGLLSAFSNLYILLGFSLYGMGAVVWLGVLSKWDVSKAYPLVGMGFLLTVLIGFLFGEDVTLHRVTGVAFISLGVWLVAAS